MNRVLRLLNIVRRRRLGMLMGLVVGAMALVAMPFSFGLLYTNLIFWIEQHAHGFLQVAFSMLMFVLTIILAITFLTILRAAIAQLFSCRWYKTR